MSVLPPGQKTQKDTTTSTTAQQQQTPQQQHTQQTPTGYACMRQILGLSAGNW